MTPTERLLWNFVDAVRNVDAPKTLDVQGKLSAIAELAALLDRRAEASRMRLLLETIKSAIEAHDLRNPDAAALVQMLGRMHRDVCLCLEQDDQAR